MQRKSVLTLMGVVNFLYVGLLLFSIVPAIFSIMFADGGSSLRIRIQIFSLLTLPVVLLISIVVPWIFYGLKMYRTALAVLALPLVNGVLILFYVLIPAWLA